MSKRISVTTRSAFPNARVDIIILNETDVNLTLRYMNDFDVTNTLGSDKIHTPESQREWLRNAYASNDKFPLGIWLARKKRLIGTTGLHHISHVDGTATFGINIGDKSEWDKGYGTETLMQILHFAFIRRNLRKVSLVVFSHNPRGKRCYEKCGFKVVGVQERHDFRNGAYRDRIIMEIFREEWEPYFVDGVVQDIWTKTPRS